jgi:hypothetical protein
LSISHSPDQNPHSRRRHPREGDGTAPNPSPRCHLLPSLPASPPPEWYADVPRGRGKGGDGPFFLSLRQPGADADARPPEMPLAGAPAAEEARAPRSGAAPAGSGGRVAGARDGWVEGAAADVLVVVAAVVTRTGSDGGGGWRGSAQGGGSRRRLMPVQWRRHWLWSGPSGSACSGPRQLGAGGADGVLRACIRRRQAGGVPPFLLDGVTGPTSPCWWGWGSTGSCWWCHVGSSSCAGLLPVEVSCLRKGRASVFG